MSANNGHDFLFHDAWAPLKKLTAARIALGRTGVSLPLEASLQFRRAHAMARDAVYSVLEIGRLQQEFQRIHPPVYALSSRAFHRQEYLQRPDLGRRLHERSAELLSTDRTARGFHVAVAVADGLSATAINRYASPLLETLIPRLKQRQYTVAPLTLVEHGRVAIADEIGEILQSQLTVILIGERPGLSSADSMGAYLTFAPRIGNTDERRNCVSNIHAAGLSIDVAAAKIEHLIHASLRLKISGVQLKDLTGVPSIDGSTAGD